MRSATGAVAVVWMLVRARSAQGLPRHVPDVALDNLWLRVEPPLQVNVLSLAEGWLRQRLQDNGTGP